MLQSPWTSVHIIQAENRTISDPVGPPGECVSRRETALAEPERELEHACIDACVPKTRVAATGSDADADADADGRSMRSLLAVALVLGAAVCAGAASKEAFELLELEDDTLQAALAKHPLMILSIGVEGCEPCAALDRKMRAAGKELRVKAAGRVTLAKLTILSQDSPVIGNIVQGQLTLPKLLVFRDGEATDFVGEPTKAGIVSEMLR